MLHVEALDAILKGPMAEIAAAPDRELLREVVRHARQDEPLALRRPAPHFTRLGAPP
jgi:hypothetical protein